MNGDSNTVWNVNAMTTKWSENLDSLNDFVKSRMLK
jgi:hypothetical protein